jgi:hypothetical protein
MTIPGFLTTIGLTAIADPSVTRHELIASGMQP